MTVSVTSDRRTFACDGTTRVFYCNFRVLEATEMVVYLITAATGASVTLTFGVDYTVAGVGDATTTVTTATAYSSAYQLKARRVTQRLQLTDYLDNDPFPAETHERTVDRLTHIAQEVDSSLARAVLVPEPETGATLEAASVRAGKLLGFNASTGVPETTAFSQAQMAAVLSAVENSGVPGGNVLGVESLTVTAGDTVVPLSTLTYTPGTSSILVWAEGQFLTPGTHFSETSGNSITLASAFAYDVELVVVVGRLVTSGIESPQVSFTPLGTGAVARSSYDREIDYLHLTDFMTAEQKSDARNRSALVDCTAAFAAAKVRAAAAGGGRILVPSGLYRISDDIDLDAQGVEFVGMGRRATRILQMNAASKVFNVTADYCGVKSLAIDYDGTPTAGGTGIYTFGSFGTYEDFVILSAYRGVEVDQGVANKVVNFDIRDYESVGVFAHDMNDLFVGFFVMDAGNSTRGVLGGIRLEGKAEAVIVTDGDILNGVYSLTTAATTYGLGTRPAYNKFTNVYFDSSVNGALIERCVETDFSSCWFSNRPENGATVAESDGVRFHGGGALNCGKHGILVQATAVRTAFSNFAARGNSTGAANTYSGILVAANTNDFQVQGCTLGGAIGFGTQKYGVEIQAGTSDRYIVADNLVSGNGTGGVSDGGSGANKRVANNY